MMHLLRKYDVARFTRNDAMFASMCRQAHIIRRSRHHWQSQHHLPKANIIQKTHLCLGRQKCVFCWRGRKDSILARPTRSVFHGSDSPPDCHSPPFPLLVLPPMKTKRTDTLRVPILLFWRGRKDSNPRHAVLETAVLPTELHPRVQHWYYNTYFSKKQAFFEKYFSFFKRIAFAYFFLPLEKRFAVHTKKNHLKR